MKLNLADTPPQNILCAKEYSANSVPSYSTYLTPSATFYLAFELSP